MKTRYCILLVTLFLINTQTSAAQQGSIITVGPVVSVKQNGQTVSVKTTNAYAEISVYSPSVIRVRIDNRSFQPDFSYAVVGPIIPTKINISQSSGELIITTDSVKTVMQKNPFAIAFYTPDGKIINQDEQGLTTSWAGASVTSYKKMQEDEHFIGLGEKTGNLDRKVTAIPTGTRTFTATASIRTHCIQLFRFMWVYIMV